MLRDECELVWMHCRDSFGQCGHGDRTEKIAPTLLNVFGKRRIVQAIASACAAAVHHFNIERSMVMRVVVTRAQSAALGAGLDQ